MASGKYKIQKSVDEFGGRGDDDQQRRLTFLFGWTADGKGMPLEFSNGRDSHKDVIPRVEVKLWGSSNDEVGNFGRKENPRGNERFPSTESPAIDADSL